MSTVRAMFFLLLDYKFDIILLDQLLNGTKLTNDKSNKIERVMHKMRL